MIKRRFLVFIVLIISFFQVKATHIVGGEIFYECLGNDEYKITLKVYRDCLNGQAPFDAQAAVTTFDASGAIKRKDLFPFPGASQVTYYPSEPCLDYSANICVEEAIYEQIITLPKIPGGYQLSYQRCCRNNAIINLDVPQDEGATYTVIINDEALDECNTSPHFANTPPLALCINTPVEIDYSAVDPDGDSLVYEFYTPLHGGGKNNNPANPNGPNTPMPSPAAPPPYQSVVWGNGYNVNYQVDGNPGFSLNPSTGILSGTPTTAGQYVLGVQVKEYRDGKLLSIIRRDFQFQTVPCVKNSRAEIGPQSFACNGNTVDFTNKSDPAQGWLWDFGVPGQQSDTSKSYEPSFTYPDTGVYLVTLIADPGYSCSDTVVDTFYVYPLLQADFDVPPIQCLNNNSFDFEAGGHFSSAATLDWSFSQAANRLVDTGRIVSGVSFNTTGDHFVTLTLKENGCISEVTKKVEVHPHPVPKFEIEEHVQCAPFRLSITDLSNAWSPLYYKWNFGNGDSTEGNTPFYIYNTPGNYPISLTVYTKEGCIDTVTSDKVVNVQVNETPKAGFSVFPLETSIYFPDVTFTNTANESLRCQLFLQNPRKELGFCSGTYTFSDPGEYEVMQVVENNSGCADTLYQLVEIKDEFGFHAPNAFTPNGDGVNDVFIPVIYGIQDYHLRIFDRWGEVVFETHDKTQGWNGVVYHKKVPAKMDAYTYKVDAVDHLGNNRLFIGQVILVR